MFIFFFHINVNFLVFVKNMNIRNLNLRLLLPFLLPDFLEFAISFSLFFLSPYCFLEFAILHKELHLLINFLKKIYI